MSHTESYGGSLTTLERKRKLVSVGPSMRPIAEEVITAGVHSQRSSSIVTIQREANNKTNN